MIKDILKWLAKLLFYLFLIFLFLAIWKVLKWFFGGLKFIWKDWRYGRKKRMLKKISNIYGE